MGSEWKKNNKDKVREQKKRYYQRYKERKKEEKKRYNQRHKEQYKLEKKRYALKKLYGISLEDYNSLLAKQNNVCAICKNPETRINNDGNVETVDLCVDHCHTTGKVRGLLCNMCNLGLGRFKDNPAILNEAILYLNNPH